MVQYESHASGDLQIRALGQLQTHPHCPPALIESEKHYRNVLRLFSDVLSAVFDGYHHPGCASSEYEALDTLRTLDTEL